MKVPVGQATRALATRLGVTEGQVYTAVIGLVVALAAAVGGIPPTLADRVVQSAPGPSVSAAPRRTAVGRVDAAPPALPPSPGDFGFFDALTPPSTTWSAPPVAVDPAGEAEEAVPAGEFRVVAHVPAPGAPQGIALAPGGRMLVATNNGDGRGKDGHPAIFVFDRDDPGDGARKTIPVAAVAPGGGISDLIVPPDGDADTVYALASNPPALFKVDVSTSAVAKFATIPDAPTCAVALGAEPCELSPVDHPPKPEAGAYDAGGGVFVVADNAQGILWRVKPDKSVSVFAKAPEFVALDGLSGVAFGKDGAAFVTIANSATAPNRGVVYRITDGRVTELAKTESGALPRGVAVGASGRVYVAESGSGRVVALNASGKNVGTLPGDPALAFDTPVRLVFDSTRLLLVEQAPTRSTAGRVVRLGVADRSLR